MRGRRRARRCGWVNETCRRLCGRSWAVVSVVSVSLLENVGGWVAYDSAITREGEHHSGVGCQGEESTMPNANHNDAHQDHGSVITTRISEDLQDGLSETSTGCGKSEVLDREQETEDDEEAEQGRESHRGDDTDGC
jgi:hypothetical protein